MNMRPKKPQDEKHGEFHDGEYEYWPVEDMLRKRRKVSFPAAVANGLEVVAAAAAAVVLAVVMTVLYVQSAPQAIYPTQADISVSVFNNTDNLELQYRLSAASEPETVLESGPLPDAAQQLRLQNLQPGTRYLLRYFAMQEGQWEQVGEFFFTTAVPEETIPPTQPPTTVPTQPSTAPPTEPTTVPTEPTTVPTEPTTIPTQPPTEPPTEPPPVPEALGVKLSDVDYLTPWEYADTLPDGTELSGDETTGYYVYTQTHSFGNLPDCDYKVTITQNGKTISRFSQTKASDGTLRISFTGNVIEAGVVDTTKVKLTFADGQTVTSTYKGAPPKLTSAELSVQYNGDGTYTFTITARYNPGKNYRLTFRTELACYDGAEVVPVEMKRTGTGVYTGTYTCAVPPPDTAMTGEQTAWGGVGAIWNKATFTDNDFNNYIFFETRYTTYADTEVAP